MIRNFKENDIRQSGVIYQSSFNQIKSLYDVGQKELAGEFAISVIELTLTGNVSSDDFNINFALTPLRETIKKDMEKYKLKVNRTTAEREERLREVARLLNEGKKQKDIAAILQKGTSTISEDVALIKDQYPYLLKNPEKFGLIRVDSKKSERFQPLRTDTDTENDTGTEIDNDCESNQKPLVFADSPADYRITKEISNRSKNNRHEPRWTLEEI